MLPAAQQLEILKRNKAHLIDETALLDRLKEGRSLRIKFGVDPTRPDLTFGHLVVFNKLRAFQDLGHEAILLIGDYTTLIGDPSGRSSTRPVLTREEISQNTKTYLDQAFKVLDKSKTVVRYNSEWFDKMRFEDTLHLARKMTVAQMLERDDFSKRYASGSPISIVEFLYPLLQGHDSVVLKADVELGGDDQLFNLLVGRVLQKEAGQKEQIVLTLPLLVGLDGEKKMSKSLDNYIAFSDSPKDIFGKVMSISDKVMGDYYRLLLEKTPAEMVEIEKLHPMEAKKALAATLVDKFYGPGAGSAEREAFEQVFSQKNLPTDMPVFTWQRLCPEGELANFVDLLAATELFPSKKEIRRLIEQGAIKLDRKKVEDVALQLAIPAEEYVIQSGKRLFFKIIK